MSDNKTIEIDEAVTSEVAAKAAEAVRAELKVPTAKEIAEEMAAMTEKSAKKDLSDDTAEKSEKRHLKTGIGTYAKEDRFKAAMSALKQGDRAVLREYNSNSLKLWKNEVSKSDYQNITTEADGAAIVPDPEFVAEVERLTDEYGVAARLANVRRTDRNQVTLLSGTNEVSFTKVGEATAADAQKLTYSSATVALDKYIAKLIMTSEWIEDAAVNVFADATQEIGRARAKLFDQLVFTDATDGLLSAAVSDTYKTHSVGAALSNLDFDDMLDAPLKVVSSARRSGAFFMHSTVWNELRKKKTGDGSNSAAHYLAGAPTENPTPTIGGYPVYLVDVMPDSGDITSNEAFAVFGDLNRVKLHVKRQLDLRMFDAGVLTDAGGNDFNLIDQDAEALRATLRVKPQTRFQGAFVIIGTGTVS